MTRALALAGVLLAALPAAAQDIRGLENCTAEKQIERRTGCLQANTAFLQQALAKLTRDTQQQMAAAARDAAAARSDLATLRNEIAALKDALAKLATQVEGLRAAGSAAR